MSFLKCVEDKYSDIVKNKCEDNNCKLNITNYPKKKIIKPDLIINDIKMCDNIIFIIDNKKLIIVLIELKNKNPEPSEIIEKLENGVDVLNDILRQCKKGDLKIDFYPVVLAEKWKKINVKIIDKYRITFHGYKYQIVRDKCGINLNVLFDKIN